MATTEVSEQSRALRAQLLDAIRSFLHEQREIEPERVQEGSEFKNDLGLDSLDLAAVAVELEDRYELTLDDEHIVTIETVADALDVAMQLLEGRDAGGEG